MIFWGGEGSRRAGAGLRFAEEWAAEEILDQVGSRLAAGRGLLDIKICMPTRQGIVCGRLKASRSRRRVTACTARRRGLPFAPAKGSKRVFKPNWWSPSAGRSHQEVTVCTDRRRGPTFVCARRRGLRSMSGHPAYAWGNPPTLRRSSFPQRASRPAGGPIPKHAWGCAPRPRRVGAPPPGKPKRRLPGAGLDDAYKAPQAHFM